MTVNITSHTTYDVFSIAPRVLMMRSMQCLSKNKAIASDIHANIGTYIHTSLTIGISVASMTVAYI